MQVDFEHALAAYDYVLPDELIAQAPAEPRDSARLLVHDRTTTGTSWVHFRDIGKFLPKSALIVLNETKVIPARLLLTKEDGRDVEVLSLGVSDGHVRVMASRKLREGETLTMTTGHSFTVHIPDGRFWLLTPLFPIAELPMLCETHGSMPLPPYIDQSPLSPQELRERYQSVFAKHPGSIAAPTASLHFTPELLAALKKSGIETAQVTLHVHLGTFSRLTAEQLEKNVLHEEEYAIEQSQADRIMRAKKEGRPVIAVGTTVVRTLESACDEHGVLSKLHGTTRLFIREGYEFRMVDHLITNFHVPKSSLLMLVCAFAGRERVMKLYAQAIEQKMRFFSFGDAMLIL